MIEDANVSEERTAEVSLTGSMTTISESGLCFVTYGSRVSMCSPFRYVL